MNTLIIYTYPNHQSLNYAFLQETLKGCQENPAITEIQVLDLYEEQFDPRLIFHEQKRRRDMYRDPQLEKYRQQLTWADKIIFIYPIWWGRPPAMLLGYIDQLFAATFAYRDKKGLFPEGLLKGKSVVCISTMKGPTHYPLLWLHNAHKIMMKRALFNFVGIKRVKFFEFGNMESKKGGQQKKLEKVYRYFREILY
ncbi:NAD(P)H-dependent oxidoreductase [Metasolibacillus sp.]|uniref:NAD(P)H-dependent oxidoreductase n=1 Tax=Metasolibacillus sp. TaxID=2703680 RepID=UPI0025CCF44C|nr:NAD(P)H-dependent oxidoreductase [Metasolibacillus sp.]MCT6922875.1 NAD(P)H-dependent oxidoreductase [Metasolibacillus sp.]MCT6938786.1 NAD(P)H-dependent oxidoreductase [Metasolibacillus sp.]